MKHQKHEAGFATLYVMILAAALMITLAMAATAVSNLHAATRHELKRIQNRIDQTQNPRQDR